MAIPSKVVEFEDNEHSMDDYDNIEDSMDSDSDFDVVDVADAVDEDLSLVEQRKPRSMPGGVAAVVDRLSGLDINRDEPVQDGPSDLSKKPDDIGNKSETSELKNQFAENRKPMADRPEAFPRLAPGLRKYVYHEGGIIPPMFGKKLVKTARSERQKNEEGKKMELMSGSVEAAGDHLHSPNKEFGHNAAKIHRPTQSNGDTKSGDNTGIHISSLEYQADGKEAVKLNLRYDTYLQSLKPTDGQVPKSTGDQVSKSDVSSETRKFLEDMSGHAYELSRTYQTGPAKHLETLHKMGETVRRYSLTQVGKDGMNSKDGMSLKSTMHLGPGMEFIPIDMVGTYGPGKVYNRTYFTAGDMPFARGGTNPNIMDPGNHLCKLNHELDPEKMDKAVEKASRSFSTLPIKSRKCIDDLLFKPSQDANYKCFETFRPGFPLVTFNPKWKIQQLQKQPSSQFEPRVTCSTLVVHIGRLCGSTQDRNFACYGVHIGSFSVTDISYDSYGRVPAYFPQTKKHATMEALIRALDAIFVVLDQNKLICDIKIVTDSTLLVAAAAIRLQNYPPHLPYYAHLQQVHAKLDELDERWDGEKKLQFWLVRRQTGEAGLRAGMAMPAEAKRPSWGEIVDGMIELHK